MWGQWINLKIHFYVSYWSFFSLLWVPVPVLIFRNIHPLSDPGPAFQQHSYNRKGKLVTKIRIEMLNFSILRQWSVEQTHRRTDGISYWILDMSNLPTLPSPTILVSFWWKTDCVAERMSDIPRMPKLVNWCDLPSHWRHLWQSRELLWILWVPTFGDLLWSYPILNFFSPPFFSCYSFLTNFLWQFGSNPDLFW